MAAPNIVNVTTIYGKTAVLDASTDVTSLIENTSGSGKVFKIGSLFASNVDGAENTYVTVDVYRSSTAYYIAYNVPVPAGATIDILNKYVYLEEGDSLRITAGANSMLHAVASYEEIS